MAEQSYGQPSGPAAPPGLMLWIFWGTFFFSHLVFLVVGYMVRSGQPEPPTLGPVLPAALTLMAVGSAVASAVGVPALGRGRAYLAYLIVRLAFAESAAIFGLVLAILGADLMWVGICAALGVLAHVLAAPTERDQQIHGEAEAG